MAVFSSISAGEAELQAAWSTASAAGKKGKWAESAKLYALAFEANSDAEIPAEFFYDYGDALMGAGQYERARGEFYKALSYATLKRPDLAVYNMACGESKLGNFDSVPFYLSWAVHLGYKNFAHMEKDSDLAAMRARPKWPALLADLKANRLESGAVEPEFKRNVAALHKALKSNNESAIQKSVMPEGNVNFNRKILLSILNQLRNLEFRTPIQIEGKRGEAYAYCRKGECTIGWYHRPLGPSQGSEHFYNFSGINSAPGYFLKEYLCQGGCEP